MHSIKRAFFWLSGAGTETLEQCPAWEQRKYVAFGATVLVPCAFAFIACAYALSTLTDNARVIYPVAAVWAFIILTIDRALLAGYRAYASGFRKLSQFSLRLVVAVLMGITIAHPLVLLLFRDTVSSVIEKDRAAEIEVVRAGFQREKEKVRSQVTVLETSLAEQRAKWNESFQARFILPENEDAQSAIPGLTTGQQTELKAAIDEGTAPFRERLAVIEKQSAEFLPQYAKLQTELGFWQAEFERELNGQRSGMRGEGPRARYMDQLSNGNLIAVTCNSRLENALVDGVEHTRAAREFLDSLVEMEKSFAEKMKLEEQSIGPAESDKLAAFEAIKKRFYEDLHHRMEIFFTMRHA
jgi:hypothetical protein